MQAFYNENDAYAAEWLQNLVAAGLIPGGHVDRRSIADVRVEDLRGGRQCHFFAGVGGWPLALRLAGWPDDVDVWTGSCPCQPFSEAGRRNGFSDERHLWPQWFRLIEICRPQFIFGEQVPRAISFGWLDQVAADLERAGYAVGACVLPACLVEAPQERERLWFVACADGLTPQWPAKPRQERAAWPVEPNVARVAHGIPEQPCIRRAYGNALVPAAAAQFVMMAMEAMPSSSGRKSE